MSGLKLTNTGWQANINLMHGAVDFLRARFAHNLHSGLLSAGNIILEKARYYAPIETGRLREHSYVLTDMADPYNAFPMTAADVRMSISVVFDMAYAVYVHENTAPYHAPPTSAKFLERAVRETVNEVSNALQLSMADTYNRGGVQFSTAPAFDRGTSLNKPPLQVRQATAAAARAKGMRMVRGMMVGTPRPKRPPTEPFKTKRRGAGAKISGHAEAGLQEKRGAAKKILRAAQAHGTTKEFIAARQTERTISSEEAARGARIKGGREALFKAMGQVKVNTRKKGVPVKVTKASVAASAAKRATEQATARLAATAAAAAKEAARAAERAASHAATKAAAASTRPKSLAELRAALKKKKD